MAMQSSRCASSHQITPGTTTSEMSVTEPHRAYITVTHAQYDQSQISATESHRAHRITAVNIHHSKKPISGTELHVPDPNAATSLQPNEPPQKSTPKRHRRSHKGRRSNTKILDQETETSNKQPSPDVHIFGYEQQYTVNRRMPTYNDFEKTSTTCL